MNSIATYTAKTLEVPGASLYYEVRGSGPVLVLMPGGPADATTFRKIEDRLAREYTVVTYDPRDLSRSQVHEPTDNDRMVEIYADDVHRLLNEVSPSRKALVFASSGGAAIVMDLIAKHPQQLEMVIAHECPSPDCQPDPEPVREAMADVCATCASEGLFPAMQKFMQLIGIQGGPPPASAGEPTPEELEQQALMQKNFAYFFGEYIRNVARYRPDFAAVKASGVRVVPAVGAESAGQLAHNGGLGMARILGTEAVVFPGDHGGFDGAAPEFGEKLLEALKS